MLTPADDYPVHQQPTPILYTCAERNFYDRYFFNGYDREGRLFFAAALGVYPQLDVMDAAFCWRRGALQRNLRASRRLGGDRMRTSVGPITVEVLEPLERLRLRVDCPEHELRADLVFAARCPPIEEPRFRHRRGPRVDFDYTRLTQSGSWSGDVEVGGKRFEMAERGVRGTRDRSWGVRPVGAADPQAPAGERQFYWLWAPFNFDDRCTFYHCNADAEGEPWNTRGVVVDLARGAAAAAAAPRVTAYRDVDSKLDYRPGTRQAGKARVELRGKPGTARLELEPRWDFYMSGLGYTHPEWGHGSDHGDLEVGYDVYEADSLDPNDMLYLHVQAFCDAVLTEADGAEHRGCGVLEQLILGPHRPSGLTGVLGPD